MSSRDPQGFVPSSGVVESGGGDGSTEVGFVAGLALDLFGVVALAGGEGILVALAGGDGV